MAVSSSRQGCAACKHQRRKCRVDDCVLYPYFSMDRTQEFEKVHKVFGISNMTKMLRQLQDEEDRERAVESFVWEATAWRDDPVNGPLGLYKRLQEEIEFLANQLLNQQQQQQVVMQQYNKENLTNTQLQVPAMSNYSGGPIGPRPLICSRPILQQGSNNNLQNFAPSSTSRGVLPQEGINFNGTQIRVSPQNPMSQMPDCFQSTINAMSPQEEQKIQANLMCGRYGQARTVHAQLGQLQEVQFHEQDYGIGRVVMNMNIVGGNNINIGCYEQPQQQEQQLQNSNLNYNTSMFRNTL